MTKISVTMRIVEYHTFERTVDAAELKRQIRTGDAAYWIEGQFLDDPMPDSDIETVEVELHKFKTLKP